MRLHKREFPALSAGRLGNSAWLRWGLRRYLKGGCREDGARVFSVVPGDRMRGNGHKVEHKIFSLNTRKYFFTVKVMEHWHSFPERLWILHPWRYSKIFLTGFGQWAPYLSRLVGLDNLQRSLPTSHTYYKISWFYQCFCLFVCLFLRLITENMRIKRILCEKKKTTHLCMHRGNI